MAEPEDPHPIDASHPQDDFDDDIVGFASPRALTARTSAGAPPEPDPVVLPEPEAEVILLPEPEPEPVLPARPEPEPEPMPETVAEPRSGPEPDREADEIFEPSIRQASAAAEAIMPDSEPAPVQPAVSKVRPASLERNSGEQEMAGTIAPQVAAPADPVEGPRPAPTPGVTPLSPRPEAAPVPEAPDLAFGQPGATRGFQRPPGRREPGITAEGDARLSLVVYACLIASAISAGATALLALFLAWTGGLLVKGWTRSHLQYQLRTSLIGVIAVVAGVLTLPLGVGVFIFSAAIIWMVVRGVAGLLRLLKHEEIRDPKTWSLP